jgi:endonuclease YncB( thermonuclease family)
MIRRLHPDSVALLVMLAAVLLISFCHTAGALDLTGTVLSVHDGDTLTLKTPSLGVYKIRIAGIDAPELKQPYGVQSGDSLRAYAVGKSVDADCLKTDRYDRWVCNVRVGVTDVGLYQVRNGLAWHYKKYQDEQLCSVARRYSQAEITAREKRRGLWADPSPTAPWDWRADKRK